MTTLKKPVSRRVVGTFEQCGVEREYIVTLYPVNLIGIRRVRTRTEYLVPLGSVFNLGAQFEAESRRRERKKK